MPLGACEPGPRPSLDAPVQVDHDVPLAPLTTLRLGGPARTLVRAETREEVGEALARADAAGERVLVLGGGSNLVLPDAGWDGTVVHIATRGIARTDERVLVEAGEPWDPLVARTVADGLQGFECLSGIPGSTGATPVQNVGAYGQETAQTLAGVRVWDRHTSSERELSPADCRFGYRSSALKGQDRLVVLAVAFALVAGPDSAPIGYAELARSLGVPPGARAPLGDVREAVLTLRRAKGMVLDAGDLDTVSAGSFFTNPFVSPAVLEEVARRAGAAPPRFPAEDGRVKTSAAWLIERAGFSRGTTRGRVSVSSKHTLALTNRGDATTGELLALAREIRDGVRDSFGIALAPEPTIVGATL